MTLRFAERPDARIAFADEGSPAAPPLLLLMGLGGTYAAWGDAFLAALGDRYRVIRVENRGVGASDNHAERFTMADMAADASAVLAACELTSAHVVGISMGGMIAQQLALDAPDSVRSLSLLSTHFGGSEVVPMTARAQVLFEPQPPGQTQLAYYQRLFTQLTAPGFGERKLDEVRRFVELRAQHPVPVQTYQAQLHALLESDRSQAVTALTHPTLVLHGVDDPLIPIENGRRLAARIPGARLVEVANCGHMPPWEWPQRVADELVAFAESVR